METNNLQKQSKLSVDMLLHGAAGSREEQQQGTWRQRVHNCNPLFGGSASGTPQD